MIVLMWKAFLVFEQFQILKLKPLTFFRTIHLELLHLLIRVNRFDLPGIGASFDEVYMKEMKHVVV